METEVGKVIGTRPGRARVEVMQSSVCSHCEAASSCVHGTGGARIIEVDDPLGVSIDQRVRIELSSGGLIGASFLAYIVPLITLFLGTLAGFHFGGRAVELWSGLGALAGLAAGLVVSRVAGTRFGKKLTPAITGVVADPERSKDNAE